MANFWLHTVLNNMLLHKNVGQFLMCPTHLFKTQKTSEIILNLTTYLLILMFYIDTWTILGKHRSQQVYTEWGNYGNITIYDKLNFFPEMDFAITHPTYPASRCPGVPSGHSSAWPMVKRSSQVSTRGRGGTIAYSTHIPIQRAVV